ncbi:MAG: Maf-like protein, partial [Planctomycetaceae bacterium]|nr:Maf-like protein [Planctomycetaceae bacterium]
MLILASGSSYRRELLSRLTPDFQCVSPDVDEDAVKAQGLAPGQLAVTLARMKAQVVLDRFVDAAVIGSDQLVNLNGQVLGKPGSPDAAVSQLLQMAGQMHELITAVAILSARECVEFTSVTRLWMRNLTPDEATRYVARD